MIEHRPEAVRIETMGRQTQLHVFPKDVNELLIATHDWEPLEVAMCIGEPCQLHSVQTLRSVAVDNEEKDEKQNVCRG